MSLDSNKIFYHKQKQPSNPEGLLLEPFWCLQKNGSLVTWKPRKVQAFFQDDYKRPHILGFFGALLGPDCGKIMSSEIIWGQITVCNLSARSTKHRTAWIPCQPLWALFFFFLFFEDRKKKTLSCGNCNYITVPHSHTQTHAHTHIVFELSRSAGCRGMLEACCHDDWKGTQRKGVRVEGRGRRGLFRRKIEEERERERDAAELPVSWQRVAAENSRGRLLEIHQGNIQKNCRWREASHRQWSPDDCVHGRQRSEWWLCANVEAFFFFFFMWFGLRGTG